MISSDGRVIGSIGCGTAATEAVLVERGREAHGVDVVPEAIESARGRLTPARVVVPDERAPFLDGLILADVIEHIADAWDALADFVRAVRSGGWVAVSVPNMRNLKVLWTFMVRGDWPEQSVGIFDSTHVQVMCPARLDRCCDRAGVRVKRRFDRYLADGSQTGRVLRAADRLTACHFSPWFMLQLQVLGRRVSAAGAAEPHE